MYPISRKILLIITLHSEILDPCNFFHIIEHSPRNWETTLRPNVFLTIFHTQKIYHHVGKPVRTTLQSNVGLQLRGEAHEMEKKCRKNRSHTWDLLLGIGEKQNINVWFWEYSTHDDIYFCLWKTVRATFWHTTYKTLVLLEISWLEQ